MSCQVRLRLSVMMFGQFLLWGTWGATLPTYLNRIGFEGDDIGNAFMALYWAAIVSPFFVGMVADRFFAAERVLGVLHLLGAVALYWTSKQTEPGPFFWAMFCYALTFMPTLALVNAISFHQMADPARSFPGVRVFGTLGWIAAGWSVSLLVIEDQVTPMRLAAALSVLMGLYSFFLPHTPPKAAGQRVTLADALGLEALSLLRKPSFAVFAVSSLLICIPLAFYYNFTNLFLNDAGMVHAAGKMTFGQMSELVFMLIMPLLFARLGVKKMLLLGMLAWVLRYLLFAYGDNGSLVWMLYAGIALHGVCYDFFFVTGQIYVDRVAPPQIRASAQGLIAFLTLGLGLTIGSKTAGWMVAARQTREGARILTDWQEVWVQPAIMAALVGIAFALLFRERERSTAAVR